MDRAEKLNLSHLHPGVELRVDLKSISNKYYICEVAFVWQLTKETIQLPLGCLQGGQGWWAGGSHRLQFERREIEGAGPLGVLQIPQIPVRHI